MLHHSGSEQQSAAHEEVLAKLREEAERQAVAHASALEALHQQIQVEVQEKEATTQMLLSKQQFEWRRAIERMRRRGVARAYVAWVGRTRETVRLVAIGSRVVHQLQHKVAGRCLACWQEHCCRCRLLERAGGAGGAPAERAGDVLLGRSGGSVVLGATGC